MNCQEVRELIHAYVDGELELVKTLDVEKHIRDCGACDAVHSNLIALRSSIRGGSLYFRAPGSLEREIRLRVKQARTAAGGRGMRLGKWVAAAAAVAVLGTGVWMAAVRVATRSNGGGPEGLLASEVTVAHVRSLMAEHLWDVKSSDQHTVKPWFAGKIDFAPNVGDFKAESFALEGGRLDYLADRPVAALVYRHEKHYINLFIWPATGRADQCEVATARQGYVLVHWVHSGMNYWAVSDMSEEPLRRFTGLVHGPGSPATKP